MDLVEYLKDQEADSTTCDMTPLLIKKKQCIAEEKEKKSLGPRARFTGLRLGLESFVMLKMCSGQGSVWRVTLI
jgi:hypothetical protein